MTDRKALLSIRKADVSPHPAFTFLSLGWDIANVRDQQLERLRVEEVEAGERHEAVQALEAGLAIGRSALPCCVPKRFGARRYGLSGGQSQPRPRSR